jgi:hypothetical protein
VLPPQLQLLPLLQRWHYLQPRQPLLLQQVGPALLLLQQQPGRPP